MLYVTPSLGPPAVRHRDESRSMPHGVFLYGRAIWCNPESYDCPRCTTGYDPVLHVVCYTCGGVSRVLPIKASKP